MADLETNDQDSLSAEEQAQMSEMQQADSKPDNTPPPAAPAKPPKPAKLPAPKADAPKAGDAPVEGADGAEGEGDKGGKGKGGPLSPEALAAVREERAEKKELRDAMAKMATDHKAAMDKAAERFETVLKTFAPKVEEPKPAELPDRDVDPVGYMDAVQKKTGETLEQITKRLDAEDVVRAQAKEQTENQRVVSGIIDQATAKEKEFLATTPDYNAASDFLLQSRHGELEEVGYTDINQRNAIILQEKVAIAAKALAEGKNPAAVVYGLAKRRGYTPKAAPAVEGDEGEGEESAAPVETEEQKAAAAKAKLKALGDGLEASASLSNLGGKGPSNLTAARLLEMDDADFDKMVNTKEGRALMGQ